jgi:chromosome segregation ATPase
MSSSLHGHARTLTDAAARLGLTPQRVSQLLTDGSLSGPEYSGRAPKNAPRVWETSLTNYERNQSQASAPSRRALARTLADRDVEIAAMKARLPRAENSSVEEGLRLELAAARAAAQELNVGSDVLTDHVQQLSEEIAVLKRSLAQRESELASLQTRYDVLKSTLDRKSNALTQLLTPHTVPVAKQPN